MSETQLRIGRLDDHEIAINDGSVSRRHAEITLADEGWVLSDLGSTNGTKLNDIRIGRTPHRVRSGDMIRIGKVELTVELARVRPMIVRIKGGQAVRVEAQSQRTWDEAVEGFALAESRWQVDAKPFLSLMRAGYRLAHTDDMDEQLQRVLDEAVDFFGAARGAIFISAAAGGKMETRCTSIAGRKPLHHPISRTPAARALVANKSLLYKDCREFASCDSVAQSDMTSIICAVMRTPKRTYGVLHLDRSLMQEPFSPADLQLAESLAAALALGVERLQLVDDQQELFLHTVTALAQAVEMRDVYTGNHTHRVTAYAGLLAEELGVSAEDRRVLRAASALHDIGKIGIDDDILRKPGRLSPGEFDKMKTHVIRGFEIIQMIPGLAWALPVVRGHHERWDGTGYPDRLKGEEIPLLARIVAVADAFDAMTSDRPYRPGLPVEVAFAEIEAGAGRQFDPACVIAFLRLRPRIEELLEQEKQYLVRARTVTDTLTARELQRQAMIDTPEPVGEEPASEERHAPTAAIVLD
jgi:HD-GYP domain-containing protein (c-di-GMP phosphodiesterase class II)/pSer/pThr/pTyr-binding forkhead associated (FHA) protein